MENRVDLMDIEIALGDAANFLICFSEFCDDEGLCIRNTKVDETTAAICFINRLPQFVPLLRHAVDIINTQQKNIAIAQSQY